jgi:hypothetical protein
MAQRALDSDRTERSLRIEKSGEAHYRVQLEQSHGRCGVRQINFPSFQCCDQRGRKRIYVHLEANGQRGGRTYSWPYASQIGAFDGLVELKSVAPEGFVTERIKTEGLPAVLDHSSHILSNNSIKTARGGIYLVVSVLGCLMPISPHTSMTGDTQSGEKNENCQQFSPNFHNNSSSCRLIGFLLSNRARRDRWAISTIALLVCYAGNNWRKC